MVLCLFGCSDKNKQLKATEAGYKLYNLENAGWKSMAMAHNRNGIQYKATLVPIQYYILKNEGALDPKKVDSIYNVHKGERVLEIEFSNASKDDLLTANFTNRSYQSAVEYMSFKIRQDFKVLTEANDTINCAGVLFERNFKLAPFKRLVLHFSGIPEDDNITLLHEDQLFGNGSMQYQFNDIPLKL